MDRCNGGSRTLDDLGIFPFGNRDEIEFAWTGDLLQHPVIDETVLRLQQLVGHHHFDEKFLARRRRHDELIYPVEGSAHPFSPALDVCRQICNSSS